MYEVIPSNQFKKDLKLAQKRGYDLEKPKCIVKILSRGDQLDGKYRDHSLIGNYIGYRDVIFNPIGCLYINR